MQRRSRGRPSCSELHMRARVLRAKHCLSGDDAARCLARTVAQHVDYLPLEELDGLIANKSSGCFYSPWLATIVPGERLTERRVPMVEICSRCSRERKNVFPGLLKPRCQALSEVDSLGAILGFYTYVVR